MQKVSIYIFEQHIADMYQDDDRVYLKQIDDICHKVSPLMLNSNQKEIVLGRKEFGRRAHSYLAT